MSMDSGILLNYFGPKCHVISFHQSHVKAARRHLTSSILQHSCLHLCTSARLHLCVFLYVFLTFLHQREVCRVHMLLFDKALFHNLRHIEKRIMIMMWNERRLRIPTLCRSVSISPVSTRPCVITSWFGRFSQPAGVRQL